MSFNTYRCKCNVLTVRIAYILTVPYGTLGLWRQVISCMRMYLRSNKYMWRWAVLWVIFLHDTHLHLPKFWLCLCVEGLNALHGFNVIPLQMYTSHLRWTAGEILLTLACHQFAGYLLKLLIFCYCFQAVASSFINKHAHAISHTWRCLKSDQTVISVCVCVSFSL